MKNVTFVLDQALLAHSGHSSLPGTLRELGHCVYTPVINSFLSPSPEMLPESGEASAPVVIYGSFGFVRAARLLLPNAIPGAYLREESFRCSQYLHRLPPELVGNDTRIYLPFADLSRAEGVFGRFGTNEIFIRPDSGSKVFTGFVLKDDEFAHEINCMRQVTSVSDESLIMCAPVKSVRDEHRFFIVNKEVITASRYNFEGVIDAAPINSELLGVAEKVAELDWQIDIAYTCDVAFFDGVPGIVELNSMSTSGLYQCDVQTLFKRLADVARLEFDGELFRGE